MQAMNYQNTVYGLPLNYKVITLIYNKKLVTSPPKTSGELVALGRKLTDAATGHFGLAYAYSDFYYHAALRTPSAAGLRRGPQADAHTGLRPREVARAVNEVGGAGQVPSGRALDRVDHLAVQRREGGDGLLRSLVPREIAKGVDFGLAPLLLIDEAGGGKPMRPWMTVVEGAYIAAPSKNKEAAFDFISYLLTDAPQAQAASKGGRRRRTAGLTRIPRWPPTRSSRRFVRRSYSAAVPRCQPRRDDHGVVLPPRRR